jgi:5-methylcytosine-specific restriction protein A
MSRTVEEWHGATDDSTIPPRVRLRIFARDEGRCRVCTRKLGVGGEPAEYDHHTALINGGEHAESNLVLLCRSCHKAKTKQDVAVKSKTARIQKRAAGIKRPRTMTRWRRMNGEIVTASRER